MFDAEFEKEINAWAEANVGASKREDRDSNGLQGELTREEVKKYVATLNNRKAAGAEKILNEFMKYRGEGMLTMMVMLRRKFGYGRTSTRLRGAEKKE